MGQKIHPLGFRLGISQNHRSNWFATYDVYSQILQEDEKIRSCIKKYINLYIRNSSNYGGITRIEIQRKKQLVQVQIYTAFPSLLTGGKTSHIAQLWSKLQNLLKSNSSKFRMAFHEVNKPYSEAPIVAEYVALQLESRVAFRRTMKTAIQLAQKEGNVKGIKVQISGRLNGAEIARVEWAREGRVPLQTVKALIDYCHYPAQTIYGVLGIKVWIFRSS